LGDRAHRELRPRNSGGGSGLSEPDHLRYGPHWIGGSSASVLKRDRGGEAGNNTPFPAKLNGPVTSGAEDHGNLGGNPFGADGSLSGEVLQSFIGKCGRFHIRVVELDERIMKAGHAQRIARDIFEIELNITTGQSRNFSLSASVLLQPDRPRARPRHFQRSALLYFPQHGATYTGRRSFCNSGS
jgi:hypothetical protein